SLRRRARMERSDIGERRHHATRPLPSSAPPHPRLANTPWIRKTVFTRPAANAPPSRWAASGGFAAAAKAHGPAPLKESLGMNPRGKSAERRRGGAPHLERAVTRHAEDAMTRRPAPHDAGRTPVGAPPRHFSKAQPTLAGRNARRGESGSPRVRDDESRPQGTAPRSGCR